jgi:DNA-binding NtrC family response regulator
LSDSITWSGSPASDSPERIANAHVPRLNLVLEATHLMAPSLQLHLGDVDLVVLGRGDRQTVAHTVGVVELRAPDKLMSKAHARLQRCGGRWQLVDQGAKNGCFVNGRPATETLLADGDVVELGSTFFVFRDGPWTAPASPDSDGDPAGPTPALGSHHHVLAHVAAIFPSLARATAPVLLGGETGTGKEVFAHAVHALSGRQGAFVPVNCGALPQNLVEAQLFGHRKGAFSGAVGDEVGLVRSADGGTLFLDEVGELPEVSQAALLRVLQEGEVLPVGSSRAMKVDLRVVAATNRDLGALVRAGRFRADLHARLRGFELQLPPLRERREDIGILVRRLLVRLAGVERAARLTLKPVAARAIMLHDWPYNVRELVRALEQALTLTNGDVIELDRLPAALRAAALGRSAAPRPTPDPRAADRASLPRDALHVALHLERSDDELRRIVDAQLTAHRGNINAVARDLGKDPKQIRRWIERFGFDPEAYRRQQEP